MKSALAAAVLVLGIIGLVAGFVWFEYRQARDPTFLSAAAQECASRYARSRTAADTQMVDAVVPASGPRRSRPQSTCGMLRRAGAIQAPGAAPP